jgi:hypothetical protein
MNDVTVLAITAGFAAISWLLLVLIDALAGDKL